MTTTLHACAVLTCGRTIQADTFVCFIPIYL